MTELDEFLDSILFQLSKGNSIESLRKGREYVELEQFKEWRNRFGYQFHVYSNDHLIDSKPHFHVRKTSKRIDCRFFFDGSFIDCKGKGKLEKRVASALKYMCSFDKNVENLKILWNSKNPELLIS
ncbi:MAG: hypothetical protein COA33_014315 [Fluviicola sp.]|nr:hypothetical protein [Fluviicola sp.]